MIQHDHLFDTFPSRCAFASSTEEGLCRTPRGTTPYLTQVQSAVYSERNAWSLVMMKPYCGPIRCDLLSRCEYFVEAFIR